jgi:hypothetical protein
VFFFEFVNNLNTYKMKFIPTKIHGILDYAVGLFLIAAPWLFRFAKGGAETYVMVTFGLAAIVYSLLTYYEYGIAKIITMRVHLGLDIISGLFLAVSPWLFGFSDYVYLPHVALGLLEVVVASLTDPVPGRIDSRNSIKSDSQIHDWR